MLFTQNWLVVIKKKSIIAIKRLLGYTALYILCHFRGGYCRSSHCSNVFLLLLLLIWNVNQRHEQMSNNLC